jgi:hypothetical protein
MERILYVTNFAVKVKGKGVSNKKK